MDMFDVEKHKEIFKDLPIGNVTYKPIDVKKEYNPVKIDKTLIK